ncbi:hypothetical protein EK21DRAFT_70383, partial [Setomelanomma holmii]
AKLAEPTSVRTLLAYGADMDPEAMFYAIGVERGTAPGTATMEVLCEYGADVNCVSGRWITPLHFATSRRLPRKVKFLLDHGADPNQRPSGRDQTALELAKEQESQEIYLVMEEASSRKGR